MLDLITRARVFATAAHAAVKQLRKYTSEPYIVHPEEVANLVRVYDGTDIMVAAAWLHDVVEDTGVTLTLIRREFGDEVANLVFWLTDVSRPEDGNRAVRKALDRAHLEEAPGTAQTIKLCDLISNLKSIKAYDPDFTPVYLSEMRRLTEVMTKAHPRLRIRAVEVSSTL